MDDYIQLMGGKNISSGLTKELLAEFVLPKTLIIFLFKNRVATNKRQNYGKLYHINAVKNNDFYYSRRYSFANPHPLPLANPRGDA